MSLWCRRGCVYPPKKAFWLLEAHLEGSEDFEHTGRQGQERDILRP